MCEHIPFPLLSASHTTSPGMVQQLVWLPVAVQPLLNSARMPTVAAANAEVTFQWQFHAQQSCTPIDDAQLTMLHLIESSFFAIPAGGAGLAPWGRAHAGGAGHLRRTRPLLQPQCAFWRDVNRQPVLTYKVLISPLWLLHLPPQWQLLQARLFCRGTCGMA